MWQTALKPRWQLVTLKASEVWSISSRHSDTQCSTVIHSKKVPLWEAERCLSMLHRTLGCIAEWWACPPHALCERKTSAWHDQKQGHWSTCNMATDDHPRDHLPTTFCTVSTNTSSKTTPLPRPCCAANFTFPCRWSLCELHLMSEWFTDIKWSESILKWKSQRVSRPVPCIWHNIMWTLSQPAWPCHQIIVLQKKS